MKPGFIELKRDFLFIADFILFLANICLECKFLAKARMTEINTLPRSLLVLFFYNPHCFAFATVVAGDEEKVKIKLLLCCTSRCRDKRMYFKNTLSVLLVCAQIEI